MTSRVQSSTPARGSASISLSNPELLIKNLRLLDLDEEFDWPGITTNTFVATDSIKNLSSRVYTAAWILYKLFEQFEAVRTKQDLGELFPPFEPKQSSLLRAAVFRRFNDLKLKGFFGKDVVIRKTMFDECKGPKFEELLAVFSSAVLIKVIDRDETDRSIVKNSLGSSNLNVNVACLSLVYQISLARQLHTREAYQRRLNKFASTLDTQQELLEQQAHELKAREVLQQHKKIPSRTLARLTRLLKENWHGDSQWIDILLSSDQHRPQGCLLELPFAKVWQHACDDTLYAIRPQQNDSRLQLLEKRMEGQRSRLDQWKMMHASILAKKEQLEASLATATDRTAEPVTKYSLRSHSGTIAVPVPEPASQKLKDIPTARGQPIRESKHRRSRSALPEITTFKLPEEESLMISRKPIANTGIRLSSSSHVRRAPAKTVPVERFQDEDQMLYTRSQIGNTIEAFDELESQAADLVTSIPNIESSRYKIPFTLADRTRISMTTNGSRQDMDSTRSNQHRNHYPETIATTPATSIAAVVAPNDLAERTRQSMAIKHSISTQHHPHHAKPRPSSMIHAVNQFETPHKSSGGVAAADATSFFDETVIELDEADIFKSRPKVAVSPVLSPLLQERQKQMVMPDIGTVVLGSGNDDDDDDNNSYDDDFS